VDSTIEEVSELASSTQFDKYGARSFRSRGNKWTIWHLLTMSFLELLEPSVHLDISVEFEVKRTHCQLLEQK
jgi:hypothetical protein